MHKKGWQSPTYQRLLLPLSEVSKRPGRALGPRESLSLWNFHDKIFEVRQPWKDFFHPPRFIDCEIVLGVHFLEALSTPHLLPLDRCWCVFANKERETKVKIYVVSTPLLLEFVNAVDVEGKF